MLDHSRKGNQRSAKNGITNDSQYACREFGNDTILVSLKVGAELFFVGKCEIEVLRGKLDVCGYILSDRDPKCVMYNVKGYSLFPIKCIQEYNDGNDEERNCCSDSLFADAVLDPGAIFMMRSFENTWCKAMRKYCSRGTALLGSEALMSSNCHSSTTVDLVKATPVKQFRKKFGFYFPPKLQNYRLFIVPESWDSIFHSLTGSLIRHENLIIGVFGGKGVGKSSLSRWLLNRIWCLSSALYYIDLDPGQAEFTMPGVVSITKIMNQPAFGPNFVPRDLPQDLMVYVGSINMADYPLTYMLAVQRIVKHLKHIETDEKTVFIVNTMGFTQGFGVDFSCDIIKMFGMTHVVEIKSTDPRRSFLKGLNYGAVSAHSRTFQADCQIHLNNELLHYSYHSVSSACDDCRNESEEPSQGTQWGNNSSDLRDTVICSYFANTITNPDDLSLTSVVPKDIVISPGEEQTQRKKLQYLAGSLVALCGYPRESDLDSGQSCDSNTLINAKLSYNRTYSDLNCLGFGLIRAVDTKKGILHVITPVQEEILKNSLDYVISAGCIAVPLSLHLQMSLYTSSIVPYVMDSRKSATKLHKATRKNYVPKRLKKRIGNNVL